MTPPSDRARLRREAALGRLARWRIRTMAAAAGGVAVFGAVAAATIPGNTVTARAPGGQAGSGAGSAPNGTDPASSSATVDGQQGVTADPGGDALPLQAPAQLPGAGTNGGVQAVTGGS